MTIRAVYEQLCRLLTSQEQQDLRISEAFHVFKSINPVQYNPYTEPQWKAKCDQYDKVLLPAEQRIAGKLRNQFIALQGNSQQVFFSTSHCFLVVYFIL